MNTRESVREELWGKLSNLSSMGLPCCFVGDFNVLLNGSEKLGSPFVEIAAIRKLRCGSSQ